MHRALLFGETNTRAAVQRLLRRLKLRGFCTRAGGCAAFTRQSWWILLRIFGFVGMKKFFFPKNYDTFS
jgi:hypothetical protein